MSSYYVNISGVPGEATATGYADQIACTSMRHSIDMSVQSGGSRVTSNSRHGPIEMAHLVDKATPLLHLAVAAGQNLGQAVIKRVNAGTATETYTLQNVYVTRVDIDVPLNPTTLRPGEEVRETFSLDYSSIVWEATTDTGTISGSYDVTTGSSV